MSAGRDDDGLIELDTAAMVRTLADGSCFAQSIAEPSRLGFGTEVGALAQLERVLELYLATARPTVLARHGMPSSLELRPIDVELTRVDLPLRLRQPVPVTFYCAVVPQGRDAWVIVPAIPHTIFVGRDEDLEQVVRGEIARLVAASDPADLSVRRLLPAEETWLERVQVTLATGVEGHLGRARALRKARLEEHRRKGALETLALAALPFHEHVREHPPAPVVGRERELAELDALLGQRTRASVVVVGDEAAGKSALVRAWLAPRARTRLVYATSVSELVAGMSGFGEWQERVEAVLEAAELVDAVLYFEHLGELLQERPAQGGVDIAGVMRRYVIENRVRVVGELTPQGFQAAERSHVSLLGACSTVRVAPLDHAGTVAAVQAHITHWPATDPDGAPVEPEVAEPLVELAGRYMPYRAFPGAAVRFLEELRATREGVRDAEGRPQPITRTDCFAAFSLTTGIPELLLREDRALDVDALIGAFRRRMIGQDEAVRRVAETVCLVKARLQPGTKPLATFLFVGPTGVGKTELARTVANYLFGAPERMVRFDMSEYTDALAADRLIRGTERQDGLLTGRVREQPFCVVLLDEIEKAHHAVLDLLLQVCGEGRLTDARGRTTYFHNAIVIMTSNLGVAHRRETIGIGAPAGSEQGHYERAVREAFRPEMVNRLDRVVAFRALTPDEVGQVTAIALEQLADRRGLQENGILLEVTEEARAVLARGGYSETYGVRALRRHLDRALITPLAHELARLGPVARGVVAWIGATGESPPASLPAKGRIAGEAIEGLRYELFRRAAAVGKVAMRGVDAAAQMRREADHLMALDEAGEVRERVALLRSQLVTTNQPRRRKQPSARRDAAVGAEMARLRTEYHRLAGACDQADAARDDLHVAEELGISALLEGEEGGAFADEVSEAFRRFRRAFFALLMSPRADRDAATVRVAQIGGSAPFRLWLLPFLAWAEARGWLVEAHVLVRHVAGEAVDRDWPELRPWSSPRAPAWLRTRLERDAKAFDRILLRVRGAGAGVMLPLEAGLHRFRAFGAGNTLEYLQLEHLTLRTELTDDEWLDETLTLPPPREIGARARAARDRERGGDEVIVEVDRRVDLQGQAYFAAIEEILLAHLLAHREDGFERLFKGRLDGFPPDPDA
ncbi:MAG TPA: AAA family ATPase [Kofleriaceae bacterium]|nr:AAA family ATPase [Kofleriaceae bacterium]